MLSGHCSACQGPEGIRFRGCGQAYHGGGKHNPKRALPKINIILIFWFVYEYYIYIMTVYLIDVFGASCGSKRRPRSTGAGLHFNFSNDFNKTDADSKSMHIGVNFGTKSA
jgi:hypothetical protein